jgi:5'-3' exonuclease
VATLITREQPSRLVVCRDDDWRPQWRVDLIPSYKAHRVLEENPDGQPDVEVVPDDLTPQVAMILEILDAFGIPTAGAPACEADDVLGTLAARERRDPVVVSWRPRSVAAGLRRPCRGQGALPGPWPGQGDEIRTRRSR